MGYVTLAAFLYVFAEPDSDGNEKAFKTQQGLKNILINGFLKNYDHSWPKSRRFFHFS